jgi:hypothetical protein
MKSPIVILIELTVGLIRSALDTISFIFSKLQELAVSLIFISSFGPAGFVIALIIGGVVFVVISKFVLKTYKSIAGFGIALAAMLLVLLFFSMM